jgi:CheY-like chemotaxis protein
MSGASPRSGAEAPRGHILVVEDDEGYGQAVVQVLQKAGYTAQLMSHFQTALEALEGDAPIDLLLTDIVMPSRVNGVALSRMARMRRRDIKVLYLTGYDIPGIDREALGPVLRKPVSPEDLIGEVERVLAAQSERR